MRGYESRLLRSRIGRYDRVEPTRAEFEAHVFLVTLQSPKGMSVQGPVIAFDEAHAIDVMMERHGDPQDVTPSATLMPCLNEIETIATLMRGESDIERDHRRSLYAARIGSVT